MRLLNRLTIKGLLLNRKRTIMTVIGIVLATALLSAVTSMAASFRSGMILREKTNSGNYHYAFFNLPEEEAKALTGNREVESSFETAGVGYAVLEGSQNEGKPYLYLMAMDSEALKESSLHVVEGRAPVREGEIVISRHIQTNGGVRYQVGDELTLTVGRRVSEGYDLDQSTPYAEGEETFVPVFAKTYRVVGITERMDNVMEDRMAPGYTVVTCFDERDGSVVHPGTVDVFVRLTPEGLRHADETVSRILGIPTEVYQAWKDGSISSEDYEQYVTGTDLENRFHENENLIRYETLNFGNSSLSFVYSMAAIVIVIILFTAVFCISNSFSISITEKMRQYGMLASVGATPRQIRKNVYYEAFLLAAVGIPLGTGSGLLACWVLTNVASSLLESALGTFLRFEISLPALLLSVGLALLTIFLSARTPARRAAKVSPISAIQGLDDIRIRAKEVRVPGVIGRMFGTGGVIAWKNMRRSRKKYRVAAASIALSVMAFVSMASFIRLAFGATDYYLNHLEYKLVYYATIPDDYEKAVAIADREDVTEGSVVRQTLLEVDLEGLPWADEEAEAYFSEDTDTMSIGICSLGDRTYRDYVKELGLTYDEAKDKAILFNSFSLYDEQTGQSRAHRIFRMSAGDVFSGSIYDLTAEGEESGREDVSLALAAVTDTETLGISGTQAVLIVSDEWMDAHANAVFESATAYYNCEDADALQEVMTDEYGIPVDHITNQEQNYEDQQALFTTVSVFCYGFILVIALIGVTNIFNTVTTGMELRSKEFAMLRSVGMTGGEFTRMIALENIFCGAKALVVGLVVGCALSFVIYRSMVGGADVTYQLPFVPMLIAVAAVVLLLALITWYSLKKIAAQNMIETIRQDNI